MTEDDFQNTGIDYLGFTLWDTPICNIFPFLGVAADFINSVISSGKKVMVSCQMGVSRSAVCAMAYLMIHQDMTAYEALTKMRKCRDVRPNDGFFQQILILDNELKSERNLGKCRMLHLANVSDLPNLPKPWNYEFFTKEVTEDEVGSPLVFLGEPCPLRLSGFSSLTDTPSHSNSISRRNSKKSRDCSRFPSRQPNFSKGSSCDILEESDFDETDIDEIYSEYESESENINADLTESKLEKVKDIITEPEDTWRILNEKDISTKPRSVSPALSTRSLGSGQGNFSTTLKPHLIQPAPDQDILSLFKVGSAAQWKSLSSKLTIDLTKEDIKEKKESPVDKSDESDSGLRTPETFIKTTRKQMLSVCWQIKPWECPKDKRLFTSLYATPWGCDCDEVYPSVFIGDKATVKNIRFLKKVGITHVLNAAEGPWEDLGFVNLSCEFYKETDIQYQGFCLWDTTGCDISPYFGCGSDFIARAVGSGGKVMINCQMGVSRSSSMVMAYMMISLEWGALEVLRELRKRRDVRPNDDFMEQLGQLDNQLRKQREFGMKNTKLKILSDLPSLPKPWHYEFWNIIPSPAELPFKLRHIGTFDEDLDGKIGALTTSCDVKCEKAQQVPAMNIAQNNSYLAQVSTFASENPFKVSSMLMKSASVSEVGNSPTSVSQFPKSLVSSTPVSEAQTQEESEGESSWEYYTDTEDEE